MMTHETSRRAGRVPTGRLVLLVAVAVAVLAGLDAALLRLGAVAPVRSEPLAAVHGVLMVYGFLGTAIMLERAVALRSGGSRRDGWGYAAPAASGAAYPQPSRREPPERNATARSSMIAVPRNP